MILSQENWNSLQKDILICVKLICLLLVSLPVLAFLIWTLRTAFPSYIVLSQSVVSSFSKSINSSLTYITPSFLKQSISDTIVFWLFFCFIGFLSSYSPSLSEIFSIYTLPLGDIFYSQSLRIPSICFSSHLVHYFHLENISCSVMLSLSPLSLP